MTPITATNDFVVKFANVNGSGSASANELFARSILRMGVPVSPRNIFPSNIQGLPTWYTIRVNKDGFIGRREEQEIVIAMNPDSFARDLASVAVGGAFYYADDIKQPITRTDVAIYPMPVKELVKKDPNVPSDYRDLVGNMVYVGVLAQMIGIELSKNCGVLTQRAADAGLLISVTADTVVRLLPPLVITEQQADEVVSLLVPLVKQFLAE